LLSDSISQVFSQVKLQMEYHLPLWSVCGYTAKLPSVVFIRITRDRGKTQAPTLEKHEFRSSNSPNSILPGNDKSLENSYVMIHWKSLTGSDEVETV